MFKLAVLASLLAGSQAAPQLLLNGAPIGYAHAGAPIGYAHAGAPIGYAHAGAPIGYAHAGAPIGYAHAGAPVATVGNYALPPVKEIREPDVVETSVEPVEQHGYSIRF